MKEHQHVSVTHTNPRQTLPAQDSLWESPYEGELFLKPSQAFHFQPSLGQCIPQLFTAINCI